MSSPAVLFGGPSPEHDVSIFTGLQAAHTLAQGGATVTAIYWAKTGDFFSVDPGLEGRDFADGAPKGARELKLVASPGGGFVSGKGGLLAKERPLDISAVVNCCHGGPGEDGTLQAALDLAGMAYTGPSVAGAGLGMDKLAFAGAIASAGLPALPRALVEAGPPRAVGRSGAVYRQARVSAARRSASRLSRTGPPRPPLRPAVSTFVGARSSSPTGRSRTT